MKIFCYKGATLSAPRRVSHSRATFNFRLNGGLYRLNGGLYRLNGGLAGSPPRCLTGFASAPRSLYPEGAVGRTSRYPLGLGRELRELPEK